MNHWFFQTVVGTLALVDLLTGALGGGEGEWSRFWGCNGGGGWRACCWAFKGLWEGLKCEFDDEEDVLEDALSSTLPIHIMHHNINKSSRVPANLIFFLYI